MSKKVKNKRLITNRKFCDGKSVEWIEIAENGVFFWVAEDYSFFYFYPELYDEDDAICSSFPVTLEFVEDMFEENGRKLDISLLPANYVANPYANWM